MKRLIRKLLERRLPTGYDIDRHFSPRYEPWDQRMCFVPTRIFDAISDGRVSVVTDEVETFTGTGVALVSGAELEADLIVTATGLNMVPFGGIQLTVDGSDIELPKALAYLGMLLSDVPDMAFAFGYTNQSWTLRGRPDLSGGVQVAKPHGPARLQAMHTAYPGLADRFRAVRRHHLGVHAASDRHVPEARVEGPVAAAAKLSPQPEIDASRPGR